MTSKRLTKSTIRDIAEAVSGEVPATFTEEILKRISAATYVATCADHVAFTESCSDIRRTLRSCNIWLMLQRTVHHNDLHKHRRSYYTPGKQV